MTLNHFHYFPGITGSSCVIDVPGLGEVTIKNCISDELKVRIKEECIIALRKKLGQVVTTAPVNLIEAIP